MQIENTQVIIIKDEKQRLVVLNFMLENNISFQSGFDTAGELYDLYTDLQYEESNENWNSSSC